MTPTTTIPAARMKGIGERGRGSPRRIAFSFDLQCQRLAAATNAPRITRGKPRSLRPPATWKVGSSWVAAIPVAIKARAVRFQARNVRSLAKENRTSGFLLG
jgi:hypothetical protein